MIGRFIVEDYIETLVSLKGNRLVGVGSSKLAFENGDTVITIPYTTDGILEMDSQCSNYLQAKGESYSIHLNPVLEYEKYKMTSPKLVTDIEDDLIVGLMDSYDINTIPVGEAFSSYNVGMDKEGYVKSFDYGEYNDGEVSCSDLIDGMDNMYFNRLIGSTEVTHIMSKEIIRQYNLGISFSKERKLFTQSMLVEEEYTELKIFLGNLEVGACELYLDGDNLKITSMYISPRFRRMGIGSLTVQHLVSMGYTITGDAVPDAYKFWEAQEVQFDDYYGEFNPLSTYAFIL